jgi:hypothetical protein
VAELGFAFLAVDPKMAPRGARGSHRLYRIVAQALRDNKRLPTTLARPGYSAE